MNYTLQKWDILRIYNSEINPPHDKFCICICPDQLWFLYINSEAPNFRKKREFAIEVANHEVICLTKRVSYIDTATIIKDLDYEEIQKVLGDVSRQHGPLMPTIIEKIKYAVAHHGVFTQEETELIIQD